MTEEAARKPKRKRRPPTGLGPGLMSKARWPKLIEMALSGRTQVEIAKALKVHASVVYRTITHPEIAGRIAAVQADTLTALRQQMLAHAALGVSTLIEVANGAPDDDGKHTASPRDRLEAAKQLLDRVGLKAPEKLEVSGPDGGRMEVSQVLDLTGATPAMLRALAGYTDEPEPLPEPAEED